MDKQAFAPKVSSCAFAFRGYDQKNLGRTAELLRDPVYSPIVASRLEWASEVCCASTGVEVDLKQRVIAGEEADLDHYAEAVALIFAMELAQIELLEAFHGVKFAEAGRAFGYSLGELASVAASGIYPADEVLKIPLSLAKDCAELARDSSLGILFSRTSIIDERVLDRACQDITAEGDGALDISAVLSPNTYLVLGQRGALAVLKQRLPSLFPSAVHLRINAGDWPPLHTSIVRQRYVPDRSAAMMSRVTGVGGPPRPPIQSLVTGACSYDGVADRDILRRWTDSRQRLWDAVCGVLAADIRAVVHVGPAPNVIPATFARLSDNVRQQVSRVTLSGFGLRAMQGIANRRWLAAMLPTQSALLRAPSLKQIVLEDWLLENSPSLT